MSWHSIKCNKIRFKTQFPPLLGTYQREVKTYVHTKICMHTFIAALFVIAKKVKTPKQNPCNKKLFNNKKMNDMLLSATTKMDLKKHYWISLKHVYYHMWNRSPVQVRCMRQGAQGWCTGMTWGMWWGGRWERGFRMGNTYTPMSDSCQCTAKTTTILYSN